MCQGYTCVLMCVETKGQPWKSFLRHCSLCFETGYLSGTRMVWVVSPRNLPICCPPPHRYDSKCTPPFLDFCLGAEGTQILRLRCCLLGPCVSPDAFPIAFFMGQRMDGDSPALCFCSFSGLFLTPVCRLFPHQHSMLQFFRCQIVSESSQKFLNLSELVSQLTQHCPSEHTPVTRPRPPASDRKLPWSLLMLDYLLE